MPSLCVLYACVSVFVCVVCILLLVKCQGLMFPKSQVYLGCTCTPGFEGAQGAWAGQIQKSTSAMGAVLMDLMLHEQFPSIQLLLGAVEWPRHSTMCDTAVPAQRRRGRLFP